MTPGDNATENHGMLKLQANNPATPQRRSWHDDYDDDHQDGCKTPETGDEVGEALELIRQMSPPEEDLIPGGRMQNGSTGRCTENEMNKEEEQEELFGRVKDSAFFAFISRETSICEDSSSQHSDSQPSWKTSSVRGVRELGTRWQDGCSADEGDDSSEELDEGGNIQANGQAKSSTQPNAALAVQRSWTWMILPNHPNMQVLPAGFAESPVICCPENSSVMCQGQDATIGYYVKFDDFWGAPAFECARGKETAVDEAKWGTKDGPTTVMIRNLPNGCSVNALAGQIRAAGFAGLFHDVHLPSSRERRHTAKYGFVRFADPWSAWTFKCAVEGMNALDCPSLGEPRGKLEVHPASRDACVRQRKALAAPKTYREISTPQKQAWTQGKTAWAQRSGGPAMWQDSTGREEVVAVAEGMEQLHTKVNEEEVQVNKQVQTQEQQVRGNQEPKLRLWCPYCGAEMCDLGHKFCPACGVEYPKVAESHAITMEGVPEMLLGA